MNFLSTISTNKDSLEPKIPQLPPKVFILMTKCFHKIYITFHNKTQYENPKKYLLKSTGPLEYDFKKYFDQLCTRALFC